MMRPVLLVTETQAIIYVVNSSQDSFDIMTTDQVDIHTGTDSQQTVTDIVKWTIKYCTENNITNPVEILRKLQNDTVIGSGRCAHWVTSSTSNYGIILLRKLQNDTVIGSGRCDPVC